MSIKCNLSPKVLLPLLLQEDDNKEILNSIDILKLDEYRMDSGKELGKDFLTIFNMVALNSSPERRNKIKNIGYLNEQIGLEVLQSTFKKEKGTVYVGHILPYNPPQSHINFFKSLPDKVKENFQTYHGAWIRSISEFNPKSAKSIELKVQSYADYYYVDLNEYTDICKKQCLIRATNKTGYLFSNKETAENIVKQLNTKINEIIAAKYKAAYFTEGYSYSFADKNWVYYNVPTIHPNIGSQKNIGKGNDMITLKFTDDLSVMDKLDPIVCLYSRNLRVLDDYLKNDCLLAAIQHTKCLFKDMHIPASMFKEVIELTDIYLKEKNNV